MLLAHGQKLTNMVIGRLLASAPLVICLEDILGWWAGHDQPFTLESILARDPEAALEEALRGRIPYGCDGRLALHSAGAEVIDRALWRWPFSPGTDYLVCATVALARGHRDVDGVAQPAGLVDVDDVAPERRE